MKGLWLLVCIGAAAGAVQGALNISKSGLSLLSFWIWATFVLVWIIGEIGYLRKGKR